MGSAQSSSSSSCCQADVSSLSDSPEHPSLKGSLQLTTEAYDRIRRRQITSEEAKVHNKDAITKLKHHSLSTVAEEDLSSTVRIQRIQQVAVSSKQLRLKVLSSNLLQKSSIISITPLGCDNSLRGAKDGITYFGCQERDKAEGHLKGPIVNDFLIPQEHQEMYPGQHFHIRFDPYTNTYRLKDLGEGPGAYTKVEAPLPLKDSLMLHIGESFIITHIIQRPNMKKFPRLQLKIYGGTCCGEIFYFNSTEYYSKKIRIGRAPSCEVHIDDTLISKVQACVFFNPQEGWIVVDGDIDTQRNSTNGTWLYGSEEVEMYNGLVFKANQTLFQALLV